MSQPDYLGSGPAAPPGEHPGIGTSQNPVPAMQPPSEPLSQKRGLIVAVLIGVNILCLAAIAAVSGNSKPKPEAAANAAATEQTTKKEAEGAAAAKTAAKEPEHAAEPSAAADAPKDKAAEPAAGDAKGEAKDGSRAVVTLPPGRANGVLRVKPDPKSGTVNKLPAGTVVEVAGKRAVGNQTWYEVKTVDFKPESTGWMHENVLKMQ